MKRNKSKPTLTKKVTCQKQKWILLEKINDLFLDAIKSSQATQRI